MPGGVLVPDNDETADWLQKKKTGAVLCAEFTQPRNYKFLKKMMALFHCCFDHFTDQQDWSQQYRGMKIEPSFDLFRKQLTILAGHYDATYDIRGNVRLEAKSLSFANCTEEEAERIYQDVISAAIKQVFKFTISEEQLRKTVEDILAFA
ncbi:hypothetical protein D3C76_47640 [compost metagenome]